MQIFKGLAVMLLLPLPILTGCTPTQETDTATLLQSALSDFTQNRSLAEQCVRDVKSRLDPSDPGYQQVMESYQDARESYNQYLDAVESGQKHQSSRSLRQTSPSAVEGTASDFIADVSRALRPTEVRSRGEFARSVVVPDNLQSAVSKLPKSVRNRLVDKFDGQIRWRSWNQL
jgi:hypothetical protein